MSVIDLDPCRQFADRLSGRATGNLLAGCCQLHGNVINALLTLRNGQHLCSVDPVARFGCSEGRLCGQQLGLHGLIELALKP